MICEFVKVKKNLDKQQKKNYRNPLKKSFQENCIGKIELSWMFSERNRSVY